MLLAGCGTDLKNTLVQGEFNPSLSRPSTISLPPPSSSNPASWKRSSLYMQNLNLAVAWLVVAPASTHGHPDTINAAVVSLVPVPVPGTWYMISRMQVLYTSTYRFRARSTLEYCISFKPHLGSEEVSWRHGAVVACRPCLHVVLLSYYP